MIPVVGHPRHRHLLHHWAAVFQMAVVAPQVAVYRPVLITAEILVLKPEGLVVAVLHATLRVAVGMGMVTRFPLPVYCVAMIVAPTMAIIFVLKIPAVRTVPCVQIMVFVHLLTLIVL